MITPMMERNKGSRISARRTAVLVVPSTRRMAASLVVCRRSRKHSAARSRPTLRAPQDRAPRAGIDFLQWGDHAPQLFIPDDQADIATVNSQGFVQVRPKLRQLSIFFGSRTKCATVNLVWLPSMDSNAERGINI